MEEAKAPGRLGNPLETLASDPRTHAAVAAVAKSAGWAPASPVLAGAADEEELHERVAQQEAAIWAMWPADKPPVPGVSTTTEVISAGPSGGAQHDVKLLITRPAAAPARPLPCVYHIHGGGMAFMTASQASYSHFRALLAAAGGFVVVGVEFRNSSGSLGRHPFPAGLDDCMAGLEWVHAHRERLGVSKIVLAGDSGGGNLSMAACLRAKREGKLGMVAGVYASCPFICGDCSERAGELPSLRENADYFVSVEDCAAMARLYDPSGANARNPLAWPYHATAEELAGLPPHFISVSELDPFRDEGIAHFRRLSAAGVQATGRCSLGTTHCWEHVIQDQAAPYLAHSLIQELVQFALSVM